MTLSVSGKLIFLSSVQFANAQGSMRSIPSGRITSSTSVPVKQSFPIVFMPVGIAIFLQPFGVHLISMSLLIVNTGFCSQGSFFLHILLFL